MRHVELVLPENAPRWAQEIQKLISLDRREGVQQLNDIVEGHEKRIDAQVYRELEFALPQELTDEQNIALAREYLEDQCGKLGIAVLANFHFDIDEETGESKPHCHALLLTRRLTEDGLSVKKERVWNSKEQHETWREQWAAYVNFHLKMHGFDQRIDHRSYADRSIEVEPQPKRGTNIRSMEVRLGNDPKDVFSAATTEKAIAFRSSKLRNACRIIRKPEIVLEIVSKHHATFMWGDVEKVLNRYIHDKDLYEKLEHKLKTSHELVFLRHDPIKQQDGSFEDHSIYTTRTMLEAEVSLVKLAKKLNQSQSHEVHQVKAQNIIKAFDQKLSSYGGLSEDQKKALYHITSPQRLSCIVGYAGAGKTTALEAAKEIWEAEGYKVYGLAPTGRAAQNLDQSGITSQTLHRFLKSYEEGRCRYSPKSVLVLDEAGMVDTQRFEAFLRAVNHLGVKAVVVGDGAQLQPVEAGPAFRLVTERIGTSRLEKVIRQKEEWQQEATKLFGTLRIREALQSYHQKGFIHFIDENVPSPQELMEKGRHKDIVESYNLSRRMVGNIYHAMVEDIKRDHPQEKQPNKLIFFHQDYGRYKEWRNLKRDCAHYMVENVDSCRSLMKELGVDPLSFAEQFVDKNQTLKTQKMEAASLVQEWHLHELDPHQRRHVCELRGETKKALIQAWYQAIKEDSHQSHLIMTYSKADTRDLNHEARTLMKQDGIVDQEEYQHTILKEDENDFGDKIISKADKAFAKGDRIIFKRNDNGLGVKNGSLATIIEINPTTIKAKLDQSNKVVSFATKLYPYFDQGWAANIHKTQGVTVDRSFMLATHETYRNLAYVGMTRHRESLQVFGSKHDFWREEVFLERLSASHEKLSALDYKNQQFVLHQEDSKLQQILNRLGNELQAIRFITKKSWGTIAERFLNKTPSKQEIRVPQPSLSEEQRAKIFLNKTVQEENSSSVKVMSTNMALKNYIHYYERDDVLRSLSRSHIENIYRSHIHEWVEKPKARTHGSQLRFGSKGEFVVNRDTGQWYSHYHGEGGDIFSFISRSRKIPYAQAIRELGEKCKAVPYTYVPLISRNERLKAWEAHQSQESIEKLKVAHLKIQKLYDKTQGIEGTIAEKYLREHRKIEGASLPSSLRFLPFYKDLHTKQEYPALVAFAKDSRDQLIAAQITSLDPQTALKASIDVSKRSQGAIKGSVVELQAGKSEGVTFVTEGIETALSLKEAGLKGRILATLGLSNMANVKAHIDKDEFVVLVADADKPHSPAGKAFFKAFTTLKEKDLSVKYIKASGDNGRDFNDVLQENGPQEIIRQFESVHKQKHDIKRTFENETVRAGIRQPAGDKKQTFLLSQEKALSNQHKDLSWRQQFEANNPEIAAKLKEEIKALSDENRLKIAQQKELRAKHLTPLQKLEQLIRKHKFAKTDDMKKRAQIELKEYALELYEQDPQLTSISIRNKEIAEQVRAIVKEDQKQKGLRYNFER